MADPQPTLLCRILKHAVASLGQADDPSATWEEARRAVDACGEEDAELSAAIEARDADALAGIVEQWRSGERALPAKDRSAMKRAMKAYRKRLKVMVLDAESSLGGGPMSGGRSASIVAITPPSDHPSDVWKELARQGRLVDAGHGMYELPPG